MEECKAAKWPSASWTIRGPNQKSKAWRAGASPLESQEVCIQRLKSLCWKPEGTGDKHPKVMAKTGAPSKKQRGRFSSFPFSFIQTTSLLVGATKCQGGSPSSACVLHVGHPQMHLELCSTTPLGVSESVRVDITINYHTYLTTTEAPVSQEVYVTVIDAVNKQ